MPAPPARVRNPLTPLWWGAIALRVVTLAYATGAVTVYRDDYARPQLAWSVYAVMVAWTMLTSVIYFRLRMRVRRLVLVDVVLTCGLMVLTPLTHTESMYAVDAPLITTVWVTGALAACAVRFGAVGGIGSGVLLAAGTIFAAQRLDVDVLSDVVLLLAGGTLLGVSASMLTTAVAERERALRIEAATAERERLARSIHDGVLQVLARVRQRAHEHGADAQLARLAGEQEVALRALIASGPRRDGGEPTTATGPPTRADSADLSSRLQVLATPSVSVSAPAGEVRLPAVTVDELIAVLREALVNVERHAGTGAKAWVLLEDLGEHVTISVRDDGCGIADGRLAEADRQGRMGVARSIKGRVAALGGTIELRTAPGAGTEWEITVPAGSPVRRRREPDR